MNETNCEKVLMAKMADMDGEEMNLSSEEINVHLADCENCRREIERMQNVDNLFNRQIRRELSADLWSEIEERIVTEKTLPIGWRPLTILGAVLVGYKLLEIIPDRNFGLIFNLLPLVFAFALFVFLRENPFKINTEIMPEK